MMSDVEIARLDEEVQASLDTLAAELPSRLSMGDQIVRTEVEFCL